MIIVKTVEAPEYTGFHIQTKYRLASIDLSLFGIPVDGFPETEQGTWYYFNRIIVPKDFPIKNAGILLMKAMAKWADEKKVNIVSENSPYADSYMTLDQLNRFDSLFGFRLVRKPNLLFRVHR